MQALVFFEDGATKLVEEEIRFYGFSVAHKGDSVLRIEGELDRLLHFGCFAQSVLQVSIILKEAKISTLHQDIASIPWEEYCGDRTIMGFADKDRLLSAITTNGICEKTGAKVNLKAPNTILRAHKENDTAYICIDATPFLLSKREYRVFNNPAAMRPTVAFQALIAADIFHAERVHDPFCGGGTISIEAALFGSGQGMFKFSKDKLSCKHWPCISEARFKQITAQQKRKTIEVYGSDWNITAVKSAQKNATIADVHVSFNRYEIEFMAYKFGPGSGYKPMDAIVTHPPDFSKKDVEGKLHKSMEMLFKGAHKVIKKGGKLVIVTNSASELMQVAKEEEKYMHMGTYPVSVGDSTQFIVEFTRL